MSWLADASANKIVKSYIQDFVDVSGNFKVRHAVSGTVVDNGPVAWSQLGSDINGEAAGDLFGYSVSINSDGTIMAVGGSLNDGGGTDSGHVRIYEYTGSSWSQLGADIDGEGAGDQSGFSVSLSSDGTIVAIGAWRNHSVNNVDSGHTRIYKYNGSSWTQLGADIDAEASDDQAGYSVSLSSDGTIVAIGDAQTDGNGSNSGQLRIYGYNGSSWTQLGADIDGEVAGDKFGKAVSLSSDGTIVACGSYQNDDNGTDSGHVRIYKYNGSSWIQQGADIDSEAAGDRSGYSVSLSSDGTIIAIGAPTNDGNGADSGHTRVYEYDGSSWNQQGSDIDGEAAGDWSGRSVSLSSDGTILATGAIFNDGNGADSGHVRIYEYDGSNWSQIGSDIIGEAAGDSLGISVSLSSDGSRLAIGALKNDGNGADAGHVRVYNKTGGTVTTPGSEIIAMDVSGGIVSIIPTSVENYITTNTYSYSTAQLGSDIVGTEAGESRGKVVDMNEDGTVLIAGSYGLNNTSGTDGGAAFIYNYQSGSWVQKGSTIKPYYSTNSAAQFGHSVAINNTGDIVVVGSYYGSGTMEVYEYINSAWSVKGSVINGNSSGHNFGGQGVAINGEGNIIAGYSMTGGYVKVYQYSDDTNDWVQIGSSISETTSTHSLTASHRPISLNNAGTRLAIGNHDHNSGAGRVIIYDYSSDSWSQVGSTIEGSNFNGSGSEFGQNVSLSSDGTILAVGAPDGGSDGQTRGTVNIFKYDSVGNTWDQMGDTLEELDSQTSAYGQDLKISGDGTLLITSDGVAPNLSSDSSYRKGTVFIYKYSDGSWARIVKIVNSDNIDQWWGESCAMSRDGTKFVGASRAMDVGATNTGLSRMYELIATVTSSTTVFDSYSYVQTMKIEDGTVDINGTTWINQGQSGASIASSNQGAFIVESAGTSSSNAVVYVETAGQTEAFSIRENGDLYSANALQHSSDDRRKTNEQYITNATETIQKLSPQIYTKLNDLVQNGGTPTKTESGLIAQEIYYNAPELRHLIHIEDSAGNKLTPQDYDLSGNDIQNDPDYTALGWGNKSAMVDYIGLLAYLIKSNQEQDACIQERQTSIDEQAELIKQYQDRVTALENK